MLNKDLLPIRNLGLNPTTRHKTMKITILEYSAQPIKVLRRFVERIFSRNEKRPQLSGKFSRLEGEGGIMFRSHVY